MALSLQKKKKSAMTLKVRKEVGGGVKCLSPMASRFSLLLLLFVVTGGVKIFGGRNLIL